MKEKKHLHLLRIFIVLMILLLFVISIFGIAFLMEKPEIVINDLCTIEVNSGEKIKIISAKYHSKDIKNNVKITSNVDYNRIGEYDVCYEVETLTGQYKKNGKVKIVDTKKPEITLKGDENISQSSLKKFEEPGYIAFDEYDGNITDRVVVTGNVDNTKEGIYTINYKVSDSSGNEAETHRNVTVKIEKPKIEENKEGVIYLTFDDGPSTAITPKVLDILKEKNVKATFFILNYNDAGAELIKREYKEGHTVAIHGYSHDYDTIYKSEEAYISNLTKLQDKIRETTGGYVSTITRFPGGSSNTVSKFNPGIMSRLTKLVVEKGFRYFDWNVSSGDAGGVSDSEQLYENVIARISKSKQNVVLMHDFSTNSKLLPALPKIIDYGIENGYTFESITETTPMVTHHVNN